MNDIRVACILGARANAWHTEVFEALPTGLAATVVGTTRGRYPVDEIRLPLRLLPWQNEVGTWPRRKLLNLCYRLTHRALRFEFQLRPQPGQLADFSVLHTWELFTDWTRVALDEKRRRGVPVIVTVWDDIPGHFASDPRRGPVRRRALREADRFVVATARSAAALAADGVEPGRVFRSDPSVDPSRFHPGGDPDLRLALGAGPHDCLVLAVARLEPAKGIGHLLEAVARARPGDRLRVAIVGDGGERTDLERLSRELGTGARVKFVGAVAHDRVAAYYRAADVFVLPSIATADWSEQWGQSLLEAMATGLACVGSRSGSIPEILEAAGDLVAPGDAAELGHALERLAADAATRGDLGRRARQRVLARYTHERAAAGLGALYRELADGASSRARGGDRDA